MSKYSDNPIHSVIEYHVKGGIRLCYEHDHELSALMLIYCGIDLMAFLSLPAHKKDVKPPDFVKWVDDYVKWVDDYMEIRGTKPPTGRELQKARNGLLHTLRPHQVRTAKDKVRPIVYSFKTEDKVMEIPLKQAPRVIVPIEYLMAAFFEGINRFLIDIYQDAQKTETVEKRFKQVLRAYPNPRSGGD